MRFLFWVISIFFLCVFFFYSCKKNSKETETLDSITLIENNTQCDLQKGLCNLELMTGEKIQVEITPRPISANQKQKVVLTIQNSFWKVLSIDLTGVEMDMGFNRSEFKKSKSNEYITEFILDACTLNEIKWRLLFLFEKDSKEKIGIPFYFIVRKK